MKQVVLTSSCAAVYGRCAGGEGMEEGVDEWRGGAPLVPFILRKDS